MDPTLELEIIMLAKLFARCGYRKPADLADFVMTGVAVAPLVVFLGTGFEEAFLVLLVMLVGVFAVFPWLHARDEVEQEQEEARLAYLKRVIGKDR